MSNNLWSKKAKASLLSVFFFVLLVQIVLKTSPGTSSRENCGHRKPTTFSRFCFARFISSSLSVPSGHSRYDVTSAALSCRKWAQPPAVLNIACLLKPRSAILFFVSILSSQSSIERTLTLGLLQELKNNSLFGRLIVFLSFSSVHNNKRALDGEALLAAPAHFSLPRSAQRRCVVEQTHHGPPTQVPPVLHAPPSGGNAARAASSWQRWEQYS